MIAFETEEFENAKYHIFRLFFNQWSEFDVCHEYKQIFLDTHKKSTLIHHFLHKQYFNTR